MRGERAVTELPHVVEAPGVYRSVLEERHAPVLASGHRNRIPDAEDLRRGMPVVVHVSERLARRAVADLAEAVVAPSPGGAVGLDRQRVASARADCDDPGQPDGLRRSGNVVAEGAVADGAEVVEAPGPDRSVALERHKVTSAPCHRRHPGKRLPSDVVDDL